MGYSVNKDDSAVINAMEGNLYACSLLLGRTGSGSVLSDDDIKWVYTGTKALNRAFIVRADEKHCSERIGSVLSLFKDKGVPVNFIYNTGLNLGDSVERLKEHGMKYRNSWCGMVLPLDCNIKKPVLASGYEILRVENEEMLESWCGILNSSFSVPDEFRDDYCRVFLNLGFGKDKSWVYYIGIKDGVPISCCMSYMEDGIAGLYWVGTVPGARKQGLASGIVSLAIDDAYLNGCRISILQASAAGKPVYERLGFKECCKFDIYSWVPEI